MNASLSANAPNVSRETIERLKEYEALLRNWTQKINLVSRNTIDHIWDRHILDSLQLLNFLPENITTTWADLGSGGGLPGLVVAIGCKELAPDIEVHLVESDQRKAAFLRKVSTDFELNCRIKAVRVEQLAPLGASVVSARALAPLVKLLHWASPHVALDGVMLFPKGQMAEKEIAVAKERWDFDVVAHQSITDTAAQILEIRNAIAHND